MPRPQPPPSTLQLPASASITFAGRLRADADDGSARPLSVAGLAVPWNTVVDLNWFGDTVEFAAGSLAPAHPGRVPFLLDHDDHPFGYGESFTSTDDGLEAVMRIPREELDDARTATAVRQMNNGVRSALSIGAVIRSAERIDAGDHDHYRVTEAELVELSSVVVPRFDDARISAIAASHKGDAMPGAGTTSGLPAFPRSTSAPVRLDADPDDDDTGDGDDDDEDTGDTPPPSSSSASRRQTNAPARRHPAGVVVPYQDRRTGARDTSLAAVARMIASTGGDARLIRAALNDITTTDVGGLIRPQYVDELLGLLTEGTPAIGVFRQGNLTSNPIVFPRWTALPVVDVVTGEKVQIPTGDATISSLTINVDTYAGGNDVSVQTIDWSSPPFIEAYFQACAEVYARKIEEAFETGLLAWAAPLTPGVGAGFVDVIGMMIGALAGKGYPGSPVLLVSSDMMGSLFVELANSGSAGLLGVVNASFPLPRFVVGPSLPAGTIIGGMSGCAITFQNAGAPIRLRAVDVDLLGVDLGVYGYFGAAALYAGGLVKVTGFVPAVAANWSLPETDYFAGGDLLHEQPPASRTSSSSSSGSSGSTTAKKAGA